MRIIKFRAKCAKDSRYAGEWVEGGVLQCEKSDDVLIVSAITDTCSCTYHVDPETVGQFKDCMTEVAVRYMRATSLLVRSTWKQSMAIMNQLTIARVS